jgi:hypothetical protein
MDRISLPMILPIAITMVTTLLIVGVGSLLLWIAHDVSHNMAIGVALALGGAVLLGCWLAARGGTEEPVSRH